MEKYPEQVKRFLDVLIELLEWYPRESAKKALKVIYISFIVLSIIVLGSITLAFKGILSGETLSFILGSVAGYIFAFLHKFLGLSH